LTKNRWGGPWIWGEGGGGPKKGFEKPLLSLGKECLHFLAPPPNGTSLVKGRVEKKNQDGLDGRRGGQSDGETREDEGDQSKEFKQKNAHSPRGEKGVIAVHRRPENKKRGRGRIR